MLQLLELRNQVLTGAKAGFWGLASCNTRGNIWLLFMSLVGLVGEEWASSGCSSLPLPVLISLQALCPPEVTFWDDPRGLTFLCLEGVGAGRVNYQLKGLQKDVCVNRSMFLHVRKNSNYHLIEHLFYKQGRTVQWL